MVSERTEERLQLWIETAAKCNILELKSFMIEIECDYDTVKAGFTLPWKQGLVEGAINKIKIYKRLM